MPKLQLDVADAPEAAPTGPIRVRVKPGEFCYVGGAFWRGGQVLEIDSMQGFSARCMERVPPNTRLSNPMSPKVALDQAVQVIRYGRLGLEPPTRNEEAGGLEVI